MAFTQNAEIELSQITVDPLLRPLLDFISKSVLMARLSLVVVVDAVVDVLAVVHVATRVQVRAVAEALVRVGIHDLLEVHIRALQGKVPFFLPAHTVFFGPVFAEFPVLVVFLLELE